MKYTTKQMIYLVMILILFAIYIWMHNLQYCNKYDKHLTCESGRNDQIVCVSSERYQISARISKIGKIVYGSREVIVDDFRVLIDASDDLRLGDGIVVSGNIEKRVIGKFQVEYGLINPSKIVINTNNRNMLYSPYFWLNQLSKVTTSIRSRLGSLFSPTHTSLVAGILFGFKESFSRTFYDALISTGTVHIIAASGYNVSILIKFLLSLFMRLFQKKHQLH